MSVFERFLSDDQTLFRGDVLYSRASTFRLVMQGSDGNAVLEFADDLNIPDGNIDRDHTAYFPIWATGTNGQNADRFVMQGDGNLVVYTFDNQPIWASNTNGNEGARLLCQTDGNLVIYNSENNPIWASGTNARGG
jgi:hypothetical protein